MTIWCTDLALDSFQRDTAGMLVRISTRLKAKCCQFATLGADSVIYSRVYEQKCELWRNFSNIFRCENVLSVSECEWQCSRKTACLHFVRYGKFMEMSSLAEVAYFSLPCINLEVQ